MEERSRPEFPQNIQEAVEQWAYFERRYREALLAWETAVCLAYGESQAKEHAAKIQEARTAAVPLLGQYFTTEINAIVAAAWAGHVCGNKNLFVRERVVVNL